MTGQRRAAVLDADTCAACRARDGADAPADLAACCDHVRNGTGVCRCASVDPPEKPKPCGYCGMDPCRPNCRRLLLAEAMWRQPPRLAIAVPRKNGRNLFFATILPRRRSSRTPTDSK